MKLRDLSILIRPLARRVSGLFSRGTWGLADDFQGMQEGQVTLLKGETRKVERFQQYGFTSVPLDGAECAVLFVGGSREHGIAVAVDDRRSRPRGLQPGECALYTDEGTTIYLRRGGRIEIQSASEVTVQAPRLVVLGDLEVSGDVSDGHGSLAGLRENYNVHTHVEHGDGGGITGPPLNQD